MCVNTLDVRYSFFYEVIVNVVLVGLGSLFSGDVGRVRYFCLVLLGYCGGCVACFY